MTTVLLYGDTARYPALRHEIPLDVMDPFLFVARGDEALVLTSSLESARIRAVLPHAQILYVDDVGLFELLGEGVSVEEAETEVALRALRHWGIERATVARDLPVAVADHLRNAGIELDIDARTIQARRRVKSDAELAGIRRAQRAADAGMAAGERLIRAADRSDGLLHRAGEPLTAEMVRDEIRATCARHGAPAPPDVMVVSARSGGGHDPGSGPLPSDLPITIDIWPRDETSACWADMTRTFVAGTITGEVARLAEVVREAIEAVREAARPGITGRELYDLAADVVERAGHPTQRTRAPGERLESGFYFSLGHGVGLEVHEPPYLGLAGKDELVAGDVIAVEPGIERIEGIGGVRLEDLLLITESGCETLTDYPYEL